MTWLLRFTSSALMVLVAIGTAVGSDESERGNSDGLKKLTTCLNSLKAAKATDPRRQTLIVEFASFARHLSTQYGEASMKLDDSQFLRLLSDGAKKDPAHADIAFALTQWHLNKQEYDKALEAITPFHTKNPGHESNAWTEYAQAKLQNNKSSEPLEIDLHFCVLTANSVAQGMATTEQFQKEVEILNRTFVALDRQPIVRFRFKSASLLADIRDSKSGLLSLGDAKVAFNQEQFGKSFNDCDDPKIRDRSAINVYIYDGYSPKLGFKDVNCHGVRNSNRPFVVLDWERLDNRIQNPEAHEMGHAFGLDHVAVPGAQLRTATNIMTSASHGLGSGGTRELGFTESQAAIVMYHAKRTARFLKEKR